MSFILHTTVVVIVKDMVELRRYASAWETSRSISIDMFLAFILGKNNILGSFDRSAVSQL